MMPCLPFRMTVLSKIWCVLLVVSLIGNQVAQVHHPRHCEPSAPCYQKSCADAAHVDDACVASHPCNSDDDPGTSAHHHHDYGCCSHVSLNAIDLGTSISLCPPHARRALIQHVAEIPGESPVYPMDKPPLIRA